MSETMLNNGAPFSDYQDPITIPTSTQDDVFYATLLDDSDSQDPVENYKRIKQEQEELGYSITIEKAREAWKQEQDFTNRETIVSIIDDPTLDKQSKKTILDDYLKTSTISDDIKDKVIFNMTNNYILENGLENDDQAIEQVDLIVSKLKYNQYKERMLENVKVSGENTATVTEQEAANKALTVAQKLERGLELDSSAGYSTEAELVWFYDMLIGKTANYLQTFFQTLSQATITPQEIIGKETLRKLFPSEQLVQAGIDVGYNTKSLTELRTEITARNEQSWTATWRDSVADALEEMGYSQELIHNTIAGTVFAKLGEAFEYLGNTLSPNDPQAIIMPLEAILFGLPLFGKSKGKGTEIVTETTTGPQPKRKATESQKAAVRAENQRQAQRSKVKASATVSAKENSPVSTLHQANRKAGSDLVEGIIQDKTGRLGEVSGLTRPQLIHYLTDPNSNIIKSTQFGFSTDISRVTQMELQAARDRQSLIENPNLADTPALKELLDEVVITLNGIIPTVPMIVSNTFSTFVRTPTGVRLSIPFIKNPGEFYRANEIVPAFDQALTSIKDNFLDAEGAVRPGELVIQELDSINNVVNEFTPDTLTFNLNPAGDYVVVWRPDGDLYDAVSDSFGNKPSDRFPTNNITDKTQRFLYDSEVSASSTGLINQLFTYGRYDKALEKRVYQDQLNKNAYFKQQERQLQLSIKKSLNKKQQNELAKLLAYQDNNGLNQLSPKQISNALGYVPELTEVNKLQEALTVYRIFDNSKYQADNVTYSNMLVEAGYDKSFYIEPQRSPEGIKNTEVMPVKAEFVVEAQDPLVFTEAGEVLSYQIWDFTAQKAILWEPEVGFNKTHYVIGKDKMPNQQVYRLARNFNDPITGDIYQYGTFSTLKPQPLPNDVLPRRPGHVPKMHEETYAIMSLPLRFKINGRELDFTQGKYADVGNKRILDTTGKLLTDIQSLTRAEVMQKLMPFASTVAMRNSKAKAYRWSRENIFGNPNNLYILVKARELTLNEVADYRIREVQSVQGQRFRNEKLDFELASDPYETAIRTGTSIGQMAYGQIGLNQLKKEWNNTYNTDPRIQIIKNPVTTKPLSQLDIESQMQAKAEFPLEATQIKDVAGYEKFGRQARADWWLIYNKEMTSTAIDTKAAVRGIRKLADEVGNLTENKKYTAWMAKYAREAQRNPQAVSGSLLRTVTTMQLMVNLPKQLFLQGLAPLTGLLTVSKNPAEFIQNSYYAIALMSRQLSNSRQLKKGELDLQATHDYFFEQDNLNVVDGPLKLTGKDYDLLVNAMKESGFSNVSDHIFTQGLGLQSIPKLGEGTNPVNFLLETLAEYGFELGELISRDGHAIVALRNWLDQNPGKNWRTKQNLDQIMFDAYRLSGSMTNVTTMGWQNSLSLRFVGQFVAFLMRMNEAAINPSATPFNPKQRAKNIAYHYAMYGTAMYGAVDYIATNMEESGNESFYNIAQMIRYTNVSFILGNMVADYILGNDGRSSESIFGGSFGLFGGKDQIFGPWSIISAFMLGIWNDDVDTRNVGATISWAKKAWGISEEISEMWIRNPESHKDERLLTSLIALSDLLPPVKGAINLKQELDAKYRRASATGHDYGLDFTLSELVFQNLWGVQTKETKLLWELQKSEADRSRSLKEHAKRFMKIIARRSDGGMPDYFEVSRALISYKLILDNKGFIANSAEHNEFVNEVMSLIGRQQTPITQNFMKKYMNRLLTGKDFSGKEIARFRSAIETAPVPEDEKENLRNLLRTIINTQSTEEK